MDAVNSLLIARVAAILFALPVMAVAANTPRFATEKISASEWQTYLDEVRKDENVRPFGTGEPNVVGLQEFGSPPNQYILQYFFTAPGHPAHPAVLMRNMVLGEEIKLERPRGHFAGDPDAYARWRKEFEATVRRVNETPVERATGTAVPAKCRNFTGRWGGMGPKDPIVMTEIRQKGCKLVRIRLIDRWHEIEMNDLWNCKPGTDDLLVCVKGRWRTPSDFLITEATYQEDCLHISEIYNSKDELHEYGSSACTHGTGDNDRRSSSWRRLP